MSKSNIMRKVSSLPPPILSLPSSSPPSPPLPATPPPLRPNFGVTSDSLRKHTAAADVSAVPHLDQSLERDPLSAWERRRCMHQKREIMRYTVNRETRELRRERMLTGLITWQVDRVNHQDQMLDFVFRGQVGPSVPFSSCFT